MNKFAVRLKELRNKKYTQKELGALIGRTGNCIHDWENGRSEPSIDDIIALAVIFEETTDYLLGRVDR